MPNRKKNVKSNAATPKQRKTTAKTRKGGKVTKGISPQKRQRVALLLFVVALFFVFVVLIPGESVWFAIHAFILGLFGHSAILWPILLIYVAVTISFEKSLRNVRGKLFLSAALVIMITTTFYLFKYTDSTLSFWSRLGELYKAGFTARGSGLMSGLIGIPLVKLFGLLGAKIVAILLDFLLLMLITGTGLAQLIRWITAPAKVVRDTATELMDGAEERRQQRAAARNRRSSIDIPLDEEEEQRSMADLRKNEKFAQLSDAVRAESEEISEQPASKKKKAHAVDLSFYEQVDPEPTAVEPFIESDVPPNEPCDDLSEVIHAIEVLENKDSEKIVQAESEKSTETETEKPKKEESAGSESIDPAQAMVIPDPNDIEEKVYRFPPVTLLEEDRPSSSGGDSSAALQATGDRLIETLKSFGVSATILNISKGPTVTRYELQPAAGVKISRITNLADDIALNLAAGGVRIEAPIPNKAAIGIEVPNRQTSMVRLRGLVDSNMFAQAKSRLTVALGKDITGNIMLADLAKMPHLLIAGSTGSGKSVCINTMIVSLLYKSTPDEVRFLMVDPKVVELGVYNGIPHLLVPVVTDPRKAAGALNWAVGEMLQRYKTFAATGVRDMTSYNHFVEQQRQADPNSELKPLPQIVIIVDELADLMMAAPNEVEDAICRLAQMARAAGMHLVIATQRPSVDVITGVIKANIPSRIAFAVSSQVDSRTILDASGAEKLLGRGDMLFAPIGAIKPTRVQGCFVSEEEIEQIVDFIRKSAACEYDAQVEDEIERRAVPDKTARDNEEHGEEEETDPMLDDAVKCVTEAGQASVSLLQRKLRLGYARAGRLIDEMEIRGVVGPHEGSKSRQVLISYAQWCDRNQPKEPQGIPEEI